ncbi:ATP-binding protein [Listeria booriae]|uniref:ATP-binding protein n=1 Tax=Listeria booriae TaxID=1552123 RepID=A0A7X0Z9M6_9LIST|nr:AAA family ATPase [Listeria booriae]MBC2178515.1 ATP-binding protein [Listeria booriae]
MFFVIGYGNNSLRKNKGFYLKKDNWNDYGYVTLFRLSYVDNELIEKHIGEVKIGYKGQGQEEGVIYPQITELEDSFLELPETYFSLGQSLEFYSTLRDLDEETRIEYLNALKDIAYNTDLYQEVYEEKVLKDSLLRNLNRKTVEIQFHRIANGGADLVSYDFRYNPNYNDDKSNFIFEVIPESLPPTNIHAIIGTNGTGKTHTLKGILKDYLVGKYEFFSNAIFMSFSIFDKREDNREHLNTAINNFTYIGAVKETGDIKSAAELGEEFNKTINNILLSNDKTGNLQEALEILNIDYNFSQYRFNELINKFSNTKKSKIDVAECCNFFKNEFSKLSSGHQIILLAITQIIDLVVEKTLILIDEPETHLHPPLLSAFIRVLTKISVSKNAAAILATHSPVVLQDISKSCVSIIRRSGQAINISRPNFETFGENIGTLTEAVFGLELAETGYNKLLKNEVEKLPNYEELIERFNNELSVEAKSFVRIYINEYWKKKGEDRI